MNTLLPVFRKMSEINEIFKTEFCLISYFRQLFNFVPLAHAYKNLWFIFKDMRALNNIYNIKISRTWTHIHIEQQQNRIKIKFYLTFSHFDLIRYILIKTSMNINS